MDFCYTNHYYYYYLCYVKASRIHWKKKTNKQRKKNNNNMLPSIWTKCMELILPLDEKRNNEEKQRKKKNTRIRYSTLTIFITTVTLNGTTIGDKLVETLYSNRVTSENKINYTPPLHSKLECLLFSTGSSNSGTKLHGGDWEGKALLYPLKSVKRQKAPFGRSVSTNFVATLHGGIGEEKLYYTLLKSAKREKAPFGRSVSTNFVAFLLTLLLIQLS